MARHYWETGVATYPQFKDLSDYCIKQAKTLGYVGKKYPGGKYGKLIARIFGWKMSRILSKLIYKV
ncbi:MAG: hypothetical protein EOP48_09190 [Sphingobacteriales bacterium]|nr:MAG: hypothetical protein EOP48_09190 [Sphingobacteriales bacterium]